MQKWEYRIADLESVRLSEQEKLLNQNGSNGWELVSVSGDGTLYFKRPCNIDYTKPPG